MNTNLTADILLDWDGLVRLFTPGSGVEPPLLAGRAAPLQKLTDFLGHLKDDIKAAPGEAVLYGPRGNGKTVFLDAFIKQCEGIDVISLTPSEIDTEADLAAQLIYDDQVFRKRLEEFKPARESADQAPSSC